MHSYFCDNCLIAPIVPFVASAHLCPYVNHVPSSEWSALQLLIAYLNEVLVSSMRIKKSFLHSFLQLPRCFRKQHHLGVSQRLLQKCWSREYLTRNACSRYLAYPWQSHESLKNDFQTFSTSYIFSCNHPELQDTSSVNHPTGELWWIYEKWQFFSSKIFTSALLVTISKP